MITDKKLRYIGSFNGLDFYTYKASLFNYYHTPMAAYEKLFSRKFRETLDYIRGNYNVIYAAKDDILVGRITLTRGGCRNKFCTTRDTVLTSLWVQPGERGKGYANIIYRASIEFASKYSKNIFAYIRHDNLPSVKSAISNGMTLVATADYRGPLHSIVIKNDGKLGIYKITPTCR